MSTLVEKLSNFDEFANWIQKEWENKNDNSKKCQEQSNQAMETNGQNFERCTVRLDGIEVYAVVSALTVASSIACLDTYGDLASGSNVGILIFMFDTTFTLSNIVGILTGLHATLVFSMVTMYGRTAIGLGRDLAFRDFFRQTGQQRYKAFKTFLISLYSFIIQCILTIAKRRIPFGPIVQLIFIVLAGYFVHLIIAETNFVVEKAGVIFDGTHVPGTSSTAGSNRHASGRKVAPIILPLEGQQLTSISNDNISGRYGMRNMNFSMTSCRDLMINTQHDDEDDCDKSDRSNWNRSSLLSDCSHNSRNSVEGLRRRRVSFKDAADGLKEFLPRMREFDTEAVDNNNNE